MLLNDLLENVNYITVQGNTNVKVSNIVYDSENAGIGSLFVCICGTKKDGHEYAMSAVQKGAVAVIAENDMTGRLEHGIVIVYVGNSRIAMAQISANYYDNPQKKLKMIGITGTNGKTTVTYLTKSILEFSGKSVGLIGTNQNIIGNNLIPSTQTTPDSPKLMELLDSCVKEGLEYVVMEVSSHSLVQHRVRSCHFIAGACTNITQEHLDYHKTMQDYIEAKAELFKLCDLAIINSDDGSYKCLVDQISSNTFAKLSTYGVKNDCDIKACNIDLQHNGVSFDLIVRDQRELVSLRIPGEFSVYNALTAAAICFAMGISLSDIVAGIGNAQGVKGRCEIVNTGKDFTVIIDYAHTPDGLFNILKTIRGFAKGRILTLFGCGGDRDSTKRPLMGKIAGENSDFCIVTSDNPRTEEPMTIIDNIVEGIRMTKCDYVIIESRFAAIECALSHARKDDIVLLAGKGHETYQILSDRTINFDERDIVLKLLA